MSQPFGRIRIFRRVDDRRELLAEQLVSETETRIGHFEGDQGVHLDDEQVDPDHAVIHFDPNRPEQPPRIQARRGVLRVTGADGEPRVLYEHSVEYTLDDGAEIEVFPTDLVLVFQKYVARPAPEADVPAETPTTPEPERPTGARVRPPVPPPAAEPWVRPQHEPSRYLADLPIIFQENEFLGRFLRIFEDIWEPLEWRQNHIDMYFHPATTPAAMLPWLASWIGADMDGVWDDQQRRRIVAETCARVYRLRGTREGLRQTLQLYTGASVRIEHIPDRPFVVRIDVTLPARSTADERLLERLIERHKPAHIGYELRVMRA
jgi:phage tail-like protein